MQLGVIGHAVLTTLLPARRARYSTRAIKCPTSRYRDRGDRANDTRPTRSTPITAIDITISPPRPRRTTPAAVRYAAQRARPPRPPRTGPRPLTRRDRVTTVMAAEPGRAWTPAELAAQLHIPFPSMRSQLAEWARHGHLTRASRGRYTLNTPTPPTSSTPAEDP